MYKNPSVTGSLSALPQLPVDHPESKTPSPAGKVSTRDGKRPVGLDPRSTEATTSSSPAARRTLNAPPAVPAAPAALDPTGVQKLQASIASIVQQALVSGASWGAARKAFQDLAPAIGAVVGGRLPAAAGELYGQIVGAAIGNVLGGAALGAAHYTAEHGVKTVRERMGSGWAMAPALKSEATKQAIFIATFTTFMAMKGLAKAHLPQQDNALQDAAVLYAMDIAFSAAGGGTAEGLTQLASKGYSAVKAKWSPDEFKARVIGGTAAGGVSMLGDIQSAATQPVDGLRFAEQSVEALSGATGSIMALSTWFMARKVVTDNQTPAAAPAVPQPAALPVAPESDALPADLAEPLDQFKRVYGDRIALAEMGGIVDSAKESASAPSSPTQKPAEVVPDA